MMTNRHFVTVGTPRVFRSDATERRLQQNYQSRRDCTQTRLNELAVLMETMINMRTLMDFEQVVKHEPEQERRDTERGEEDADCPEARFTC